MNRVFVTDKDKAAVGAEETGLVEAAVGAEATGPDGSAGAASATLGERGEAASPGEAVADADKFLRNEVVGWMSSLEAVGSSLPEALDAVSGGHQRIWCRPSRSRCHGCHV